MRQDKSQKPYLSVNNASYVANNGQILLENVNFCVNEGDIVAIVGPNGAGKTTLIRMIAGLIAPSNGSVTLDQIAITTMSFADRAMQIAYVGQSDNTDGRLSVAQYISLGILPQNRGSKISSTSREAANAIAIVGLGKFSDKRMDQLSGGEAQKAKIARAICQKPKLLVLDEPTNHLDPQARGELLSLVAQMGITVVTALHDLTLIEAFAHKTAILANGKLQQFGTSVDVFGGNHIREVFGVELHRIKHPFEDRHIPTLDIQISADAPAISDHA